MKVTKSLSTEKELIDEIMKQAEKENRSFSNLIETVMLDYLNKNKNNEGDRNENIQRI